MFNLFLQVQEEKRKAGILSENHSREIEALRADLNGQLSALKTSYDQKIVDLERRLEVALGKGLFEMAAMPFTCNGILLIQDNLPRVIQVIFQCTLILCYFSYPLFQIFLWGMVNLWILNIFGMYANLVNFVFVLRCP